MSALDRVRSAVEQREAAGLHRVLRPRASHDDVLYGPGARASAVRIAHVQLHRREILANLGAVRIAGCPTSMVGGLECPCFRRAANLAKKFGRFLCTK